MSKPVVISVFGTRPEAIKMAPVVLELNASPELEHRLVVTAQHRGLLDDVLNLFRLKPDHDLDLMRPRQSLGYITSGVLTGLSDVFEVEKPDFVLVHGDTTTTFAASLAAFYGGYRVGHVEAGLRTSTVKRPFPEELNRRITDLLADHYYCPTPGAAENLKGMEHEGRVFITGNTALDAVRLMSSTGFEFRDPALREFAGHDGPRLLITAHRRENWGVPMESICRGIGLALDDDPSARACFCWHPNPAVRETVSAVLGDHPRVVLINPPRYEVFVNLMAASDLILTDSGGIQEEVTQLGKFALVLRDETERPESVEAGFARVVGTDGAVIRSTVGEVLADCRAGRLPAKRQSPFGDGYASRRILEAVCWAVGCQDSPPADFVA